MHVNSPERPSRLTAMRLSPARLRMILGGAFCVLFLYALGADETGAEALEIGRRNVGDLPKGKEADGLVGDFVLRNAEIELLIGGNQPLRRPNMKILPEHPTPGTLYDLDLRGGRNDQLTSFRPGAEKGAVSYVRIVDEPPDGAAAVETVRTAAAGDGLAVRHEYLLRSGRRHVQITSTWRNESAEPKRVQPRPEWLPGLSAPAQAGEIRTADSIDPFDKRGYAWAPVEPGSLPEERTLAPGETASARVILAVGRSPVEAYGLIAAELGATGEVTGRVVDPSGEPAVHAALLLDVAGVTLKAYPDQDGRFALRLPPGSHELRLADIGRPASSKFVRIEAGRTVALDWTVPSASRVAGAVRDAAGSPLPAKIQFLGRNGTPTPNFGPPERARGGDHQYQTHDGIFDQQVPPGEYLLRITHGSEYSLFEREVSVAAGETVSVEAALRREVDTSGWISTDFHSHSTPSGDNYTNTVDRLINLAAEHIEFAPTTEHNRIDDWRPRIERLGLSSEVNTVPGIELTGWGQHFNAFPLTPDPYAQNGGAPMWFDDPRMTALALRNWTTPTGDNGDQLDIEANANARRGAPVANVRDRWVQANHPTVEEVFFDRDQDGVGDGGFVGFERLIDAAEVWSTEILHHQPLVEWPGSPGRKVSNRTFYWLQMLNQGRRVWCVAVSDSHRVFGGGVGAWRTYVPSSTDEPGEIDSVEIIRNAKAGRMMITNGPFLEVETADGLPIGSSVQAEGHLDLKIRVQAPGWIEVDRVQVLVNGRIHEAYNFTAAKNPRMFRSGIVRFDETVRVELSRDAHLIVAAVDEDSDLEKGWGLDRNAKMRPTAYTNPIYVDTAHDGFQANGDALGHPLPVVRKAD